MADNKEYYTLPGDKGNINISEDVIASVAANAARDVDGVASLGRDNGEIWGKDVAVELGRVVKRNAAVHKVGTAVQDAVKSALEGVTGAKVSEINVQILGVQL